MQEVGWISFNLHKHYSLKIIHSLTASPSLSPRLLVPQLFFGYGLGRHAWLLLWNDSPYLKHVTESNLQNDFEEPIDH